MLGSIKKTIAYAKRNGVSAAYYAVRERLEDQKKEYSYEPVSSEELSKQKPPRQFFSQMARSSMWPGSATPSLHAASGDALVSGTALVSWFSRERWNVLDPCWTLFLSLPCNKWPRSTGWQKGGKIVCACGT